VFGYFLSIIALQSCLFEGTPPSLPHYQSLRIVAGGDLIIANIFKFKSKGNYKLWRIKILSVLNKENVSSIFDSEFAKSAAPIQILNE